jgi:hypothetical protein
MAALHKVQIDGKFIVDESTGPRTSDVWQTNISPTSFAEVEG